MYSRSDRLQPLMHAPGLMRCCPMAATLQPLEDACATAGRRRQREAGASARLCSLYSK